MLFYSSGPHWCFLMRGKMTHQPSSQSPASEILSLQDLPLPFTDKHCLPIYRPFNTDFLEYRHSEEFCQCKGAPLCVYLGSMFTLMVFTNWKIGTQLVFVSVIFKENVKTFTWLCHWNVKSCLLFYSNHLLTKEAILWCTFGIRQIVLGLFLLFLHILHLIN